MTTLTNYNLNESGCDEDRHQAPSSTRPYPLSLQDVGDARGPLIPPVVRQHSVGTGGGCGEGRGPGACPRRGTYHWPVATDFCRTKGVRQASLVPSFVLLLSF